MAAFWTLPKTVLALLGKETVTVTEYDSADYNGGTLTVSTVSGTATVSLASSASTVLGNVQKAATGSNVEYYNGSAWIPVGTWSGGAGADFVVTWNSSATAGIAERVIENLTYANSSQAPSATRTLTFALNDGDGGSIQNATITVTIITVSYTHLTLPTNREV